LLTLVFLIEFVTQVDLAQTDADPLFTLLAVAPSFIAKGMKASCVFLHSYLSDESAFD
jgi:hypothetical protein